MTGVHGRCGKKGARRQCEALPDGWPKADVAPRRRHELLQPPAIARRIALRGDVVAGLLSDHAVAHAGAAAADDGLFGRRTGRCERPAIYRYAEPAAVPAAVADHHP